MFISVRRYEGVKKPKDLVHRVENEFVPIVSKINGFIAYYLTISGNNVVLTTSIFDNQKGVSESDKKAAEWVKKSLADFVTNPPQITEGDVLVHKTKMPAKV